MKSQFLMGFAFSLITAPLFAQSTPTTAATFFDKIGMRDQVQQLDEMIKAKVEEKKSTFQTPEQFEKFKGAMLNSFNSKSAEAYFQEYLQKNANEDSLKQVISMYNDPMVKEFALLEKAASGPAKQQEVIAYAQGLQKTPPSQQRVQLLVQLNQELNTSELAVRTVKNLLKSIVVAANGAQPKEKQMTEAQLNSSFEGILPASFSQQMANQILVYMLFTYKDTSDEKLTTYLAKWKTPAGKYCSSQALKAFDYTFVKMGETAGRSISSILK